PRSLYSFGFTFFEIYMQVWQYFIQAENKKCSQPKANKCWNGFLKTFPFAHLYPWGEQRPKTCGNHHTSGKTEHAIKKFTVHFFEEKYQCSPQPGKPPRKKGSIKCGFYRVQRFKIFYYCFHINWFVRKGFPRFFVKGQIVPPPLESPSSRQKIPCPKLELVCQW